MTYKLLKSDSSKILFKEKKTDDEESDLSSVPISIQLMKIGVFSYWSEGDMAITSPMFAQMCQNFANGVRGIDLAIDYGHRNDKEAAGWITGLRMSDDKSQLLADIKWTPKATQSILDGEYRYISAEWADNYKSETNGEFGATLFGAGLTNRPFLKEMTPLSALDEQKNRENNMTIEELKKSVEALQTSVKALQEENKSLKASQEEKEKKISDLEIEKRETSEKSAKENAFNKLLAEGKTCEAQRVPFLANDMAKFAELHKDVNLKNAGHGEDQKPVTDKKFSELNSEEATDKLYELAEKAMKDNPKKFADISVAISHVLHENKELSQKHYEKFNFLIGA